MHRILIVDEDEHLLWALEKNLFPDRDDFELVTASEGAEGLEILKEGEVDLLVSDIKMPGEVDGFQLILRAKEVAPDARVIIMTALGSSRVERFADRMGITHYIEKPFNISDLRDIALDLLDEKEGFQGMLSDLELTDIIQMLCLSNRSTILHLQHKEHRGKIVFDQGDLVHAEFDNEEGVEAVYEMLALRQGDIFMETDVEYDERTIHVGWQDLLLEAAKRADEARLAEQAESDADDGTPFASFRPSESAEIELDKVSEADESAEGLSLPGSEVTDDAQTSRLAGDSFFTEEELEEIGVASSDAMEGASAFKQPRADASEASDAADAEDLEEASHGETALDGQAGADGFVDEASEVEYELEEASEPEQFAVEDSATESISEEFTDGDGEPEEVDGALEAPPEQGSKVDDGFKRKLEEAAQQGLEESIEMGGAQLASDGGQRLANESSGFEAFDASEANDSTLDALLGEFASECNRLQLTGLAGVDVDGASVVAAARRADADSAELTDKVLEIIDCADRVAGTMKDGAEAGEVQLILSGAYVVVRQIEETDDYHFAVVDRSASLGVVLVLMRQFAGRFARALNS